MEHAPPLFAGASYHGTCCSPFSMTTHVAGIVHRIGPVSVGGARCLTCLICFVQWAVAKGFRRTIRAGTEVKESTLAAHVQAATANAPNRAQNHPYYGSRAPLLRRIDHGCMSGPLTARARQQPGASGDQPLR